MLDHLVFMISILRKILQSHTFPITSKKKKKKSVKHFAKYKGLYKSYLRNDYRKQERRKLFCIQNKKKITKQDL